MSAENELINEINAIAHPYRQELERLEARFGTTSQAVVDNKAAGEVREKFARMDADLSKAEAAMQRLAELRELNKRLAAPQYEARAPKGAHDLASPEYAQRWLKAVANGDAAEMRALSLGTSGAGIPTDMERRIVERIRTANVMRQLGVVTQIDSKRTIPVENALPTTALVTEASSISASDPSFSTAISVVPYKLATRVTMSQEFIEDAIGLNGIGSGLQYVADRCGLSIGLKMEEYMTTGTGSSEPEGIETTAITQTETVGAGGAGNSFNDDGTADMIINTVFRVPPQYRSGPRFSWVMHDSMVQAIRKLKSNSGTGFADYLWKPSDNGGLTEGVPGTIFGIPYRINQYMNQASSTTNADVIAVIGNFNYYEIFDRTGVTSLIDPYSAASTHQVNLYMYTRFDSHVMLPEAFANLTV